MAGNILLCTLSAVLFHNAFGDFNLGAPLKTNKPFAPDLAMTPLGRKLTAATAMAAQAPNDTQGCDFQNDAAACHEMRVRSLNFELLDKARDGLLESADERRRVVEILQSLDDDGDDWTSDHIRALISWAEGRVIADEDFIDDEESEEQEQVLSKSTTWKGPQFAKGLPWPDRKLLYSWHPDLLSNSKRLLKRAMNEIEQKTCIQFEEVPYGTSDRGHVLMKSDENKCSATLGYGYKQQRRLTLGWMCGWYGIALHELLHSLGVGHEQSRSDRDFFIEVVSDNIKEGKESNFEKSNSSYTSIPYDYMSVMHYGRYAFSNNWFSEDLLVGATLNQLAKIGIDSGDPTIKTMNPHFVDRIGQRSRLSNNDLEQLLHMYQCPKLALASQEQSGLGLRWPWSGFVLSSGYEAIDVDCNPGFVPTSCSCYHTGGSCRGAIFSEASGGSCWAAGKLGAYSGLKAHAICHKLSSPHYMVARLSAEGSGGSASIACGSNYRLVGCSCLTHSGANCDATPSVDAMEGRCSAASSETVYAQAMCVRTPAIEKIEVFVGEAGANSDASCPAGTQLTGCSCASAEAGKGACAGARPTGVSSNSCSASATSAGPVIAYALCGHLLSKANTPLPAADYFFDGHLTTREETGEFAPVQSVYCSYKPTDRRHEGCDYFALQRRTKAYYDCKQDRPQMNCKNVALAILPKTVTVSVKSSDGQARCPAGWVAVAFNCEEAPCERVSVTCAAPPSDATWFLSGSVSVTPFFSGSTNSAVGTCGDALAIGIQCADGDTFAIGDHVVFPSVKCKIKQLLCRRVAIVSTDDEDRRGSFDIRLLGSTWSSWVSSVGVKEHIFQLDLKDANNELSNPNMHPIQQVQCRSNSCDDLRFLLPKEFGTFNQSIALKGTPTIWTTRFREGEMKCPEGHFLASMRCTKSWCEEKELLCAAPLNESWVLSGEPYYSHCFTSTSNYPWSTWVRDFRDLVRGRSRTCAGTEAKQMPDAQSCGPDGVVVGLRCYGSECDRLQLLCSTVDANVNATSGVVQSSLAIQTQMFNLGLYNDAGTWLDQPQAGLPAAHSRWNGHEILNSESFDSVSATILIRPWLAIFLVIFEFYCYAAVI